MRYAIEILLIVGIFVNLIKGGELILRPHQQKWLQDKFETFVLMLDYTKPLEWYINKSRKKVFWISGWSIGLGLYGLAGAVIQPKRYGGLTFKISFDNLKTFIAASLILLVFSFTKYVLSKNSDESDEINSIVARLQKPLNEWLTDDESVGGQISRLLFVGITASIFVIITGALLVFYIDNVFFATAAHDDTVLFLLAMAGVVIIGSIVWIGVRFAIGVLIFMILFLSMLFTELLLKLLRGLTWRIAEYNKGAFAALVLVATALLGVAEFYVRFKNYPPPAVAPASVPGQTSPERKSP